MVEETTVQDEHKGGKSRFALGVIAASAVWVILILVVIQYWRAPDYRAPTSAPSSLPRTVQPVVLKYCALMR